MDTQIKTALIVAGSTTFGVLISQAISILLSFLDKRHKKHILLRQKYEEMMFHFQDSLEYYNQVGACRTLDQLEKKTHRISANRAMGLALLYFQNLAPLFDIYLRNQIAYYHLILESFNPNIPATAGAQARVHNKTALKKIEQNLFQSKDNLIDAIKMNTKKYTKA